MDDVVERLRVSKLQGDAASYEEGLQVGEQWAREDADARQLKRLERLYASRQSQNGAWDGLFDEQTNVRFGPRGLAGYLFAGIEGGTSDFTDREFWQFVFADLADEALCDALMLKGFVDGALKLWWSVKGQL